MDEPENPADEVARLRRRIDDLTGALAAVQEQLEQERADRTRTEEALRERERDSRLIVDNIPGLVALLSATGEVEVVNRQVFAYFGQTLEELRSWGTNDTIHPEDRPHVIDVFSHSIATGRPYEILQRFRRADGGYRWFANRGFPVRDKNGSVVRWCVLLTDVEERKRAEDALRDSERQFRLLVETLPGLVWRGTPEGELDYLNQSAVEYLGHDAESLSGGRWLELVHPDQRDATVRRWMHSAATGTSYDDVYQLRRADGQFRWIQSVGEPFHDAEGRIAHWFGLITDIHDRKHAEDAVRANERNLQLIIHTIPALAWSACPDGTADFFNQHYLDFMGLSAEQAAGWGWTAAVHPDDVDELAATWQRIRASQEPGDTEARLRRHDGEYRWFLFRASPLRDERGDIVKWYGVNTDIEERKRAEAELRRAHGHLTEAQRLSTTGSFITDLVADERDWSEEMFRIFELDPATQVTNKRVRDLVHPEDLAAFDAAVNRALEGADLDFSFRIVTASGKVKHLHEVAHVLKEVSGHPVFTGAFHDVTETRAAEEALNRARAELTHVARAASLSALTASIAHEVNQPLSGILTNASTCLRMLDTDPPDVQGARETARRTIRDGNRASDVITRLRALFSKKELALEPLDLNEATQEVLALSLSELQRNRVIVQSELAVDLPSIAGDRVQLQQVILNLLRNASDAMLGVDDRPRQLLIKTEPDGGDRVRLTVRDAGIGIERQGMEKLFDAFYTTKAGGMGIGLSVSRSIVERHQGRLWAEPNEGPGTTFSFSIPCDAASSKGATA